MLEGQEQRSEQLVRQRRRWAHTPLMAEAPTLAEGVARTLGAGEFVAAPADQPVTFFGNTALQLAAACEGLGRGVAARSQRLAARVEGGGAEVASLGAEVLALREGLGRCLRCHTAGRLRLPPRPAASRPSPRPGANACALTPVAAASSASCETVRSHLPSVPTTSAAQRTLHGALDAVIVTAAASTVTSRTSTGRGSCSLRTGLIGTT